MPVFQPVADVHQHDGVGRARTPQFRKAWDDQRFEFLITSDRTLVTWAARSLLGRVG
jgi:hypothetical protein